MISFLLRLLLYPSPQIEFTNNEIELYEGLSIMVSEGRIINYQLPFQKYRFLHYLSLKGTYEFHGSNNPNIARFEPNKQTLYNNEMTNAVFASTDSIWSIFFAIFNRKSLIGSFRNGCIVNRNKKYHYYSINKSTMKNKPWTEGMIYILPREKFKKSDQGTLQFDEWICYEPVFPVAKMRVNLADFYYKNRVATHKDDESLLRTWIFYKARTLLVNSKRASNST